MSPEPQEPLAPSPPEAPPAPPPAPDAPPPLFSAIVPPQEPLWSRAWAFLLAWGREVLSWIRGYCLGKDPTFWSAFALFAVIAIVLYSRWFATNFIFDEQEALLANPYVNATQKLRFIDAIHRDFWGLLPDRSIGSYRPIPNFLWRAVWSLSKTKHGVFHQAFIHHFENVLLHAVNAGLMTVVTFAWTKRRGLSWIAGLIFVTAAILTEAVSGIVGLADVLGGMGALLALWALSAPAWAMPFGVFTAVAFGLFSKESALVCVPLIPFAALLVAPLTHPTRPARFARAALAFVAAATAFYLYVELRKKWFPSPLPKELQEDLPENATFLQQTARDFLVWFHQAPLPKDPLNNPLAKADTAHRIAGALRVYHRGLVQVLFPRALSGDYSFPQEPIPDKLVTPEIALGAAWTVGPLLGSLALWFVVLVRERRERLRVAAAGLGQRGRLLPVVLQGLGVAALLVWPAMVLRALMRGQVVADAIPFQSPIVTVPIATAAVLWVAAAALQSVHRPRCRVLLPPLRLEPPADPYRSTPAATGPRDAPAPAVGRLLLRVLGLGLLATAIGIVVVDFLFLRPQGKLIQIRHLPLWVFAVPVAIGALGLLIEGAPEIADPFALLAKPGRPLGLAGTSLVALGITWIVVSYFPHSNIPVVLPTVRAERFWYFPVLGSSLALAVVFAWLFEIEEKRRRVARIVPAVFGAFIALQAMKAYGHAMDYRSDLDFWRATKDAVPHSAKAHLNYSVMKGARGDLPTRLHESKIAMALAPDWAMAHIYTGDTLCRMHRAPEAWPHYEVGFDKDPNGQSLIALALQCLYDEKELMKHEDALRTIAAEHEGSWIAYLAIDTLANHEKNKGVDPKYRPRGYNDGPKE